MTGKKNNSPKIGKAAKAAKVAKDAAKAAKVAKVPKVAKAAKVAKSPKAAKVTKVPKVAKADAEAAKVAKAPKVAKVAKDPKIAKDAAKAPKVAKADAKSPKAAENDINRPPITCETPPSRRSEVILKFDAIEVNKSKVEQPVVEQSKESKVDEDKPTATPGEPTEMKFSGSIRIVYHEPTSSEVNVDKKRLNWYDRIYEFKYHHPNILANMLKDEKNHRPRQRYMRNTQKEISDNDRAVLINWMVKTARVEDLDDETLYLAVSIIDRFLSLQPMQKCHLQIIGLAALFIAGKYEEANDKFKFLNDKKDIRYHLVVMMEKLMLLTLNFQLRTPTACAIIYTYATVCEMKAKLLNLTLYISELSLSLMNGKTYMRFLPSKLAFGSLALARHILSMDLWTPELEEITSYTPYAIGNVARKLSLIHKSAINHIRQETRTKFFGREYKAVARIQPVVLTQEILDEFYERYYAQKDSGDITE